MKKFEKNEKIEFLSPIKKNKVLDIKIIEFEDKENKINKWISKSLNSKKKKKLPKWSLDWDWW